MEQARVGFLRKWKLCCKAVSASFEEAGDDSLPLPVSRARNGKRCVPPTRWNGSTRNLPADQNPASLPSEEAVLFLLFGLCAAVKWAPTPRRLARPNNHQ